MATQTFPLSPSGFSYAQDQLEQAFNPPCPALIPNFPSQIQGPTTWSGSDIDQPVHILEFSEQDVLVVETALERFKGLGMHGDQVSRELFPLPGLESRLDRCALEVHNGTGLCVIRGIESRYSIEDYMIIYLGISSYIGNRRGLQDAKGSMLSHVTDSKNWTVPLERRHGIHTNFGLPHHCDMGSDILSLHIRKTAAIGGRLCVASSHTVYNELARSDPSALRTLMEPNWPKPPAKAPYTLSPLFEFHQGNLLFSMDPARLGPLVSAPRSVASKLPPLTAAQLHALGRVQQAARQHEICLESEPGDMVYLNSWSTLHARQPYQDGETFSRHLVRLWLRNDTLGWPVPDSMRMPWDSSFGAAADRVLNRKYPLVPMPVYMEPRYHNTTAAFVPDDEEDEDEELEGAGEEANASGGDADVIAAQGSAASGITTTTTDTTDDDSSTPFAEVDKVF
ncbi:taurine catabolism dioxygenase TauD [Apiospora arundinis]